MLQRFHSHHALDERNARVPADNCAHIVAAGAARRFVGRDVHFYTATHEVAMRKTGNRSSSARSYATRDEVTSSVGSGTEAHSAVTGAK